MYRLSYDIKSLIYHIRILLYNFSYIRLNVVNLLFVVIEVSETVLSFWTDSFKDLTFGVVERQPELEDEHSDFDGIRQGWYIGGIYRRELTLVHQVQPVEAVIGL